MNNVSSVLKDIYAHCAEMQKLADTKNTGLIAFNSAVIIGMTKLTFDSWGNKVLAYTFLYVIVMCLISIFINLSAMFAQLRHYEIDRMSFSSENPLFFGKVSQMKTDELIDTLKHRYELNDETGKYE